MHRRPHSQVLCRRGPGPHVAGDGTLTCWVLAAGVDLTPPENQVKCPSTRRGRYLVDSLYGNKQHLMCCFPAAGVDLTSLESQLNVPINLTGLVSSNVAGALDDVANSLQGVVSTGNNVVEQIQRYGVRTLTNLEDNHKGQIDDVSGLLRSPTPLL